MSSKLIQITQPQYRGIRILLEWCVKHLKESTTEEERIRWKANVDFLAKIQRGQFYNTKQQLQLNRLRYERIHERNKKILDV